MAVMELDPVLDRRLAVPDVEQCVTRLPDEDRAGRHWTQASVERAVELALATDTPLDPTTCRIIALGLAAGTREADPLTWFGRTGMISASRVRMHLESVEVELEVVPWVSAVLQFVDSVPERDTPHVFAMLGPLASGWVDLGRPEQAVVDDLRTIVSQSLAAPSGTWRVLAATGFGRLGPMHIERALLSLDPVGRRRRLDALFSRAPLPPLWDMHLLAQRIMAHGDAFTALVDAGAWPSEERFAASYLGAFATPGDFHRWAAHRAGWLGPLSALIEEHGLHEVVDIDWDAFEDSLRCVVLPGERSWHAFSLPREED